MVSPTAPMRNVPVNKVERRSTNSLLLTGTNLFLAIYPGDPTERAADIWTIDPTTNTATSYQQAKWNTRADNTNVATAVLMSRGLISGGTTSGTVFNISGTLNIVKTPSTPTDAALLNQPTLANPGQIRPPTFTQLEGFTSAEGQRQFGSPVMNGVGYVSIFRPIDTEFCMNTTPMVGAQNLTGINGNTPLPVQYAAGNSEVWRAQSKLNTTPTPIAPGGTYDVPAGTYPINPGTVGRYTVKVDLPGAVWTFPVGPGGGQSVSVGANLTFYDLTGSLIGSVLLTPTMLFYPTNLSQTYPAVSGSQTYTMAANDALWAGFARAHYMEVNVRYNNGTTQTATITTTGATVTITGEEAALSREGQGTGVVFAYLNNAVVGSSLIVDLRQTLIGVLDPGLQAAITPTNMPYDTRIADALSAILSAPEDYNYREVFMASEIKRVERMYAIAFDTLFKEDLEDLTESLFAHLQTVYETRVKSATRDGDQVPEASVKSWFRKAWRFTKRRIVPKLLPFFERLTQPTLQTLGTAANRVIDSVANIPSNLINQGANSLIASSSMYAPQAASQKIEDLFNLPQQTKNPYNPLLRRAMSASQHLSPEAFNQMRAMDVEHEAIPTTGGFDPDAFCFDCAVDDLINEDLSGELERFKPNASEKQLNIKTFQRLMGEMQHVKTESTTTNLDSTTDEKSSNMMDSVFFPVVYNAGPSDDEFIHLPREGAAADLYVMVPTTKVIGFDAGEYKADAVYVCRNGSKVFGFDSDPSLKMNVEPNCDVVIGKPIMMSLDKIIFKNIREPVTGNSHNLATWCLVHGLTGRVAYTGVMNGPTVLETPIDTQVLKYDVAKINKVPLVANCGSANLADVRVQNISDLYGLLNKRLSRGIPNASGKGLTIDYDLMDYVNRYNESNAVNDQSQEQQMKTNEDIKSLQKQIFNLQTNANPLVGPVVQQIVPLTKRKNNYTEMRREIKQQALAALKAFTEQNEETYVFSSTVIGQTELRNNIERRLDAGLSPEQINDSFKTGSVLSDFSKSLIGGVHSGPFKQVSLLSPQICFQGVIVSKVVPKKPLCNAGKGLQLLIQKDNGEITSLCEHCPALMLKDRRFHSAECLGGVKCRCAFTSSYLDGIGARVLFDRNMGIWLCAAMDVTKEASMVFTCFSWQVDQLLQTSKPYASGKSYGKQRLIEAAIANTPNTIDRRNQRFVVPNPQYGMMPNRRLNQTEWRNNAFDTNAGVVPIVARPERNPQPRLKLKYAPVNPQGIYVPTITKRNRGYRNDNGQSYLMTEQTLEPQAANIPINLVQAYADALGQQVGPLNVQVGEERGTPKRKIKNVTLKKPTSKKDKRKFAQAEKAVLSLPQFTNFKRATKAIFALSKSIPNPTQTKTEEEKNEFSVIKAVILTRLPFMETLSSDQLWQSKDAFLHFYRCLTTKGMETQALDIYLDVLRVYTIELYQPTSKLGVVLKVVLDRISQENLIKQQIGDQLLNTQEDPAQVVDTLLDTLNQNKQLTTDNLKTTGN